MLQAIIFDLDGTLTKLKLPLEAMRSDTKKFFISKGLPPELIEPADGISSTTGKARKYFIPHRIDEYQWDLWQIELDGILSSHEDTSAVDVTLMDGTFDTLSKIRKIGLKTAILTNNGRNAVDIMLSKIPLTDYFEVIQTRHESRSPKPYPDGLHQVVERLGIDSDEAVYVGDALIDGVAARRAGVEFWGVATGETKEDDLRDAGATIVVSSLREILDHVVKRVKEDQL